MNSDRAKNTENKIFCILPWVHMQLRQTGDAYPCCRVSEKHSYGSTRTESIDQIWNSENIKKIRTDMLDGKPQKFCTDCYNLEKIGDYSYRQMANDEFADLKNTVISTKNIVAKKSDLQFLDLRFSNICNFKCRSCNPDSSSSWHDDYQKVYPNWIADEKILKIEKWAPDILNQIESQLPFLQKIYFAGGEPLIDKNHYLILEKLIEIGRTDILLSYNTNMSHIKHKKWDCLRLWSNFKNVQISASIDAIGKPLELIRKGANWDVIWKNIFSVKLFCPWIKFNIYPTVSIMNIFNLTQTIQFFIDKKIILNSGNIKLNLLNDPDYLNVNILTAAEKNVVISNLRIYLDQLKNSCDLDLYEHLKKEFLILNNFLYPDLSHLRPAFRKYTFTLDKSRTEKTAQVIPELFSLLYES